MLVKVKDTFYRGKVIDVFEDRSSILFVDYGSVTLVHFKDIFKWHPRWDTTPGEMIVALNFTTDYLVNF